MNRRRAHYLSLAVGLLLWIWIGSYVVLREFCSDTGPFSKIGIDDIYWPRQIQIPGWVEPVKWAYHPLVLIDERVTGEPIQLGKWRIHVGATADF